MGTWQQTCAISAQTARGITVRRFFERRSQCTTDLRRTMGLGSQATQLVRTSVGFRLCVAGA
jgi:hypothetical protein